MTEPPTDFAYIIEEFLPEMTVAELLKNIKKVTTITASPKSISRRADFETGRRMLGSRKFYEICKRGGVGWYLPTKVKNRLPLFPKDAVCSVVPVTIEDSALRECRIKIGADPKYELYALRVRWYSGNYFFVLIREDSWD